MPRIDQSLFKITFYLFGLHPKSGKVVGPFGTGCIVVRNSERVRGHDHFYAVSNKHVVCRDGASIIRLNTNDDSTRQIEFDPSEWTSSSDDDLAIVDITDKVSFRTDDTLCFGENIFATQEFIRDKEVGAGDDVFMIGLFASHDGGKRNTPAARFGNISMMANPAVPIPQEHGPPRPCHLIDMRSRTGFSGSPVYVYRTPASDTRAANSGQWAVNVKDNLFLRFLGVHRGQFHEPIEVEKKPLSLEALGQAIREGDDLIIPSSMTIVVPAWRVSELMENPKLKEQRRLRDERNLSKAHRTPRTESADAAPREGVPESVDLGRFNQMVGRAVKPPKPSDET